LDAGCLVLPEVGTILFLFIACYWQYIYCLSELFALRLIGGVDIAIYLYLFQFIVASKKASKLSVY
jgi:hypothetical protein